MHLTEIHNFSLSYFRMEYGSKLNPKCSLRTARGMKRTRQKVIVSHNPSEIYQNQSLEVRDWSLLMPGTGAEGI